MEGLFELLQKQHKHGAQDTAMESLVLGLPSTGKSRAWENLQISIKSILVSAGSKCQVSNVIKDYYTFIGKHFPIRELGCYNAIEVLKKMPDVCDVLEDGTDDPLVTIKASEKSAHILEMVKKSKSKPKLSSKCETSEQKIFHNDIFIPFHVQDGIRQVLFENNGQIKPEALFQKLGDKYDLEDMDLVNVPCDMLSQSLPHLLIYNGRFIRSSYKIEKSEIDVPKSFHYHDEVIIPSYRISKLERQICRNILELLNVRNHLNIEEIPSLYVSEFGKKLDWERLGFRDLWKLIVLLPDNFKLVQRDGRHVIFHNDCNTSGSCDLRDRSIERFTGHEVLAKVLGEIKELSLLMNTGLHLKYLETSYEGLYHKKLGLVLTKDIDLFVRKLHDLKIITLRAQNGKIMIHPFYETDTELRNLRFHGKPETISNSVYPEEVMKPKDSLDYVNFEEEISLRKHMCCIVNVTAVENPNSFYVRIRGTGESLQEKLEAEFNVVYNQMQNFYKFNYNKFKIPITHLRLDMVCAGCVEGEWQRVLIMDFTGPKGFMVKSLDYGTFHYLRLESLNYLKKEYARLPILAYKSSLFNIRPVGCQWTIDANQDFIRLTSEGFKMKPLIAYLVHRNNENTFQLTLTDVSCDEDKHIEDQLIALGHADIKYSGQLFHNLYC